MPLQPDHRLHTEGSIRLSIRREIVTISLSSHGDEHAALED